jgi:Ca2+-binding RTX toxin-like protein
MGQQVRAVANYTDLRGTAESVASLPTGVMTSVVSTLTVTDDATLVLAYTTNGSGAVASGTSTDDTTPVLSGTLSGALGANEVVSVYGGATLLGQATVSGTTWTYTVPNANALSAGSHALSAKVVNTVSALTQTAGVPSSTALIQGLPTPSLTADVGTVVQDSIKVAKTYADTTKAIDASVWKSTNLGATSNGSAWVIGGANAGTNNLGAISSATLDTFGDMRGVSADVTINRTTQSVSGMQVKIGAKTLAIGNVWNQSANYTIYWNGVQSKDTGIASGTKVSVDVKFLSDGSAQVYLNNTLQYTTAANQFASTDAVSLGFGRYENQFTVHSLAPQYALQTTSDATPTLSGKLAAALGADERLGIYDGGNFLGDATVSADGSWRYSVTSSLAEGQHQLLAKLQDSTHSVTKLERPFQVLVDTAVATVTGTTGNDNLTGTAGNDVIQGGLGSDTLTGGLGADVFRFVKGETGTDTVADFSKTQGDKLNLSSLLSGVSFDKTLASDVAKYLQLSSSGNDAVLKVDLTGTGNFTTPAETINLTGANVASNMLGASLTQLLDERVFVA